MMPLLIQYLVKLSISLGIVWMFYYFVLRKLTFYNSNRWYLLGYTLLSFLIPFVNISPVLEKNEGAGNGIMQFIPSVHQYTVALEEASHCPIPIWSTRYDKWDWIAFALITGAAIFLLRFIIRYLSFRKLRSKAKLISGDDIKLYQVEADIIPFSFGNAVFINSALHTETELQEIIRHEFVHVRQRHTVDIIWAELLCMLNWYNPFAWLLKTAIRQNLEFIADHKVLENGMDKKQYQYLLLKVIGNNHFSIASQFNFSSLKKRIAMMNKMRTAKVHLLRFLFILPLLAVILLSFRKQKQQPANETPFQYETGIHVPADTIPGVTEPNEKGYIINIKDNKGNCTIVIKDKNGKEVKRLLLTEWNKNEDYYEGLYGKIPPPPPPPPPVPPTPPAPPIAPKLPGNVTSLNINNDKATVILKDGTKEKYDLKEPGQKAAFEKKYGEIPEPPAAPEPPVPAVPPSKEEAMITAGQAKNRALVSNHFEITDKKATLQLKNGKTEEYDLTNAGQRKKFENKYGRIIAVPNSETGVAAPYVVLTGDGEQSVIAPMNHMNNDLTVVDRYGHVITGTEDILVVITKNSTKEQLEEFRKQMKEKDIELKYDNMDYNDGKLVSISGTMRSADGHSNFVATDFNKLVLAMIRKGDKTYFKVSVKDNKTVI
ncbi:MAG: M56 family metallopeptidase [Chitinophagaceae bacterium]|nr:M56 family metallopeptidase [Chitinophagaceae bacterium]